MLVASHVKGTDAALQLDDGYDESESTMEMPGFTAEASLDTNAQRRRLRAFRPVYGRYSRIGQRPVASLENAIAPAACCEMRCTHPEEAPWAWDCDCTWECPI